MGLLFHAVLVLADLAVLVCPDHFLLHIDSETLRHLAGFVREFLHV